MKKIFFSTLFVLSYILAFAQPVRTTITDDGVNVTISTPVNTRVVPICDFHWTFVDGQLQMWIEGRNELIPGGRLGNFTVNGATTQGTKLAALGAISDQCAGGGGLDSLYLSDGTLIVSGDTIPSVLADAISFYELRDTVTQTTHGFSILTPIHKNTGSGWQKADSDAGVSSDSLLADAIVIDSLDANTFVYQSIGNFTYTSHGKTVAQQYYLQPTAGTSGAYETAGCVKQFLFIPLDANTLFINVDQTPFDSCTGGGGGSSTFLGLSDTPSSYSGQALKTVRVNSGETALEFSTVAVQGGAEGLNVTSNNVVLGNSSGTFGGADAFSTDRTVGLNAKYLRFGDATNNNILRIRGVDDGVGIGTSAYYGRLSILGQSTASADTFALSVMNNAGTLRMFGVSTDNFTTIRNNTASGVVDGGLKITGVGTGGTTYIWGVNNSGILLSRNAANSTTYGTFDNSNGNWSVGSHSATTLVDGISSRPSDYSGGTAPLVVANAGSNTYTSGTRTIIQATIGSISPSSGSAAFYAITGSANGGGATGTFSGTVAAIRARLSVNAYNFGNYYGFYDNSIYGASSGSAPYISAYLTPSINQTGTSSGTVTGIDYNPTLTALLGTHYGLLIRPASALSGFGVSTPTAKVEIGAGTTAVAPLKLTSGTNKTTPANGELEYDGNVVNFTNSTAVRGVVDVNRSIVSSAGTLTLATTYNHYVFSGTTTTWTLPTVASSINMKWFIKNRGSGDITINTAAAGNDIYSTSAVNTYAVTPGSAIILFNDGTYFNVE